MAPVVHPHAACQGVSEPLHVVRGEGSAYPHEYHVHSKADWADLHASQTSSSDPPRAKALIYSF